MAWNDRIKEAAYTSPSGVRTLFDYEDVSREFDKKTTAFNFPDADGTYVQDLGKSGRRYPLRLFFWGGDYDLRAAAFEDSLGERGAGRLEHPVYGTVDVVPFGTITRRDDLKTAANQAVIELAFFETIGLVYPTQQSDPGSQVLQAVDEYNAAAAEDFADGLSTDTAGKRVTLKNTFESLLGSVKSGLQTVADTQDNVRKQFNAVNDSINSSIDVLIGQPLNLAFQTSILIQAPARALGSITARLDAYGNLANLTISGNQPANENNFRARDLTASGAVTGSVLSVVNNQFDRKTDALQAAEDVLAQFERVNTWKDDNLVGLDIVDTGAAYQRLQEAVALTAGFLVEISFSLKQERRVVLDRARTIIDLSAELYGSVDDQLDFLILSNGLSGSEILELPRGREIVYYV